MTKFTSKFQAMNTRRIIWVCKACNMPHDKKKLGLKGKPEKCLVCRDYRTFFKLDSYAELRRYGELYLEQKLNIISNLETQVAFELLTINRQVVSKYYADFVYKRGGQTIIEDVKGSASCFTDLSKHKIKHLEKQLGIKIHIIYRS